MNKYNNQKGFILLVPLILILGVISIILIRNYYIDEHYNATVKKDSIKFQDALTTMQISKTSSDLDFSKESEIEATSQDGEKYTITLTPLFNETEKVVDEVIIDNSVKHNEGTINLNKKIANVDNTTPQGSGLIPESLNGYNFNRVKSIGLNSTRFGTAFHYKDLDGSQNTSNKLIFDKVVQSSTKLKKGVTKYVPHTSLTESPKLEGELGNTNYFLILVDNIPVDKININESNINKDSNGGIEYIEPIPLGDKVPNETSLIGKILSLEFYDKKDKLLGYTLNLVGSSSTPVNTNSNLGQVETGETNLIILNDYASSSLVPVDANIHSTSSISEKIEESKGAYNYIQIDTYQELSCDARESYAPTAIFTRANGTRLPNAIDGNANEIDMNVPNKEDFKLLLKTRGIPEREPSGGLINYIDSRCEQDVRNLSYDGHDLYGKTLPLTQSYWNGFNTLSPIVTRMFNGSRSSLPLTVPKDTFNFGNDKLDPTLSLPERFLKGGTQGYVNDLYHYKYDPTVTNITSRNKLYCSDFDKVLTPGGPLPFPYMSSEKRYVWDKVKTDFINEINERLALFEKEIRERALAGEIFTQEMIDEEWKTNPRYNITFQQFAINQGLTDSNGNDLTTIPCVSNADRNNIIAQYKPRLNNSSSLQINFINNTTSEVKITIESDLAINNLKNINEQFCNGADLSGNFNNETNRRKAYECKVEQEVIKGWDEVYVEDSASLITDKRDDVTNAGSNENDRGTVTELKTTTTFLDFNGSVHNTLDLTTTKLSRVYEFNLAKNFDHIKLSYLRTKEKSSLPELQQVTFQQTLNNSVPSKIRIESEIIKIGYFKMVMKDKNGKKIKTEYVSVEP